MTVKNAFYAQSGGVTSVINTTASAVIQAARKYPNHIGTVYAGKNGILGALKNELIDTRSLSDAELKKIANSPGGVFGSCRYKLNDIEKQHAEYEKLIEVFKANNIGYFFYNGGGDSQDTANKVAQVSKQLNYHLQAIGIPKTIDNDLPFTDFCPGFASVAKYVATSVLEATLDVASMSATSTKVFIMEVMGRHTGWIAAASGLAKTTAKHPPHVILFPEIIFDETAFLAKIKQTVDEIGYATIVVSEGIKNVQGKFLSDAGTKDAFGHKQLGGVAPFIAALIKEKLGLKYHYAICDYLQRAARHIASKLDVEVAYKVGEKAVEFAIEGENAIMPCIKRIQTAPYIYEITKVPLSDVANQEKLLPHDFITEDGFGITKKAHDYLLPLIQGEAYPEYVNGLPDYYFKI